MQIKPIVSIILLATIVNVLHGSGQLLLKSGFESPVRVTGDMGDLMGSDHGEFKGWDATPAWIESSRGSGAPLDGGVRPRGGRCDGLVTIPRRITDIEPGRVSRGSSPGIVVLQWLSASW